MVAHTSGPAHPPGYTLTLKPRAQKTPVKVKSLRNLGVRLLYALQHLRLSREAGGFGFGVLV